jgi:hypothetical protein
VNGTSCTGIGGKVFVWQSCGFINEELPAEIQKFAKEQQVLV